MHPESKSLSLYDWLLAPLKILFLSVQVDSKMKPSRQWLCADD
jgi:hypothetical protein